MLARFFVRQVELFARVIFVKPDKAQVQPDIQIGKPALRWGELLFEHRVIMRFADPASAQVQNAFLRITQVQGFDGMTSFFPE